MKLLLSLPLSDTAQKYYGSTAPTYNKVGDAGIDLPFIGDVKPYDAEVTETIGVISFETVFAMYDNVYPAIFDTFNTVLKQSDIVDILTHFLTRKDRVFCELTPSHFDIRPRSSIGKSPFRLANCVGTIDKTYRGIEIFFDEEGEYIISAKEDALGCYLDYHPQLGKPRADKHVIYAGDRLLQVVSPNLDDILWVRLDFTEANCLFWSEVIGNKNRGGFGSTN
jgi:dUTPase